MTRGPCGKRLGGLAVCAALAAAGLGLAAGLTLAPDATTRLRDDAYYEFTWAANVASGRGPTVSDGATTSGVQLLWSLLLVPFAWLFGAGSLPAVAPWLGTALHGVTAGLLWLTTRDRRTGLVVGLCWLGQPLLVRECQNGQETALACLAAVVLWSARAARARTFAGCAVLAVLARSDLFALVLALSWWRHRQRPWRAVPVPFAVLAVHVAGNLWLGGGAFPDSALPMAWLWHANFAATQPSFADEVHAHWWYWRPVLLGGPWVLVSAMGSGLAVFTLLRPIWPRCWCLVPLVAVAAASLLGARDLQAAALAAVLLAWLPAPRRRGVPKALLALCVGLAAIVVLHWAVRWYPRDYYAAPLVLVGAAAAQHWGRWPPLLLAFALAQALGAGRIAAEPLAGQQELQMAGACLREVLPAGERVGCFNSGLVTFGADVLADPAERRAVVNLDGVVDARSFAALKAGQLSAWLDAQSIRCVLDNPVQFAADPSLPHACGRWFGPDFTAERDLVEVARFDAVGVGNGRPGGDSVRLYWRRDRGERPRGAVAAKDLGAGPAGLRLVLWPGAAGQVLEVEAADGRRRELVAIDADTTVVLGVPHDDVGTGRLFLRGGDQPVMVLPRL